MIHRRILLAIVTGFCLAASAPYGWVSGAPNQPAAQASVADLIKEIRQLRSRVVELEKRVAELEMQQTELHADQRGVLFNAQGKPVGIWGVDGEYDSLSR
ncbi:MAG TPA: hypothetical protein VF306_11055 [Pirellulales bacterium]